MTITNSHIQINSKISTTKHIIQVIDQTFKNVKKIFAKSEIEELARETNFIQRSSSKITGFDFLITLLVSCTDTSHSSLEQISNILSHVSRKVSVTSQAIMKRINTKNTVDFLKAVYSKTLDTRLLALEEIPPFLLEHFSKILIQDSSTIILHEKLQESFKGSGGRASSSFAKLDVIYDYKAKEYESIRLTDQSEADQRLALRIETAITKNSLVIRDLGYLRIDGLKQIIDKEAFFLSRLRADILVFLNQEDERPIDLATYLTKHCEHGVHDQILYITSKKLQVRLVAYNAPQEVADKRRRGARAIAKKQGRTLRESTLRLFNFTVFITNIPSEIWKPEVIGTIYRIRWQIELIFKCWKSRAEIEYLKGTNPERIRCLIYAKLIYILIAHQIYRLAVFVESRLSKSMVSMPKVFDWMRNASRLIKLIKGLVSASEQYLFMRNISKNMCMQHRKRKSTFERVCEKELFDLETS